MPTFNFKKIIKITLGIVIILACVRSIQAALADPDQERCVSTGTKEENLCAICRDDLGADAVVCTPCMHLFHTNCLRQALAIKKACPLCRTDFTVNHQDFLDVLQIHKLVAYPGWAQALVVESSNSFYQFADPLNEGLGGVRP
jgi:hypothetical protein